MCGDMILGCSHCAASDYPFRVTDFFFLSSFHNFFDTRKSGASGCSATSNLEHLGFLNTVSYDILHSGCNFYLYFLMDRLTKSFSSAEIKKQYNGKVHFFVQLCSDHLSLKI